MPNEQDPPLSDREEILARNVMIDVNMVATVEKLEKELRKLGVKIKPSYKLEPPLGGDRNKIPTRNH